MNVGLITARGGSKGIPNKNLVDLGGLPLLAWTIETAKKSGLDRVILSTDDPQIYEVGRSFGVEAPFVRPHTLATDSARSIDVAIHAAIELRLRDTDNLMLLQPTNPFRSVADINLAIGILDDGEFDSAVGVLPVGSHHPERMLRLMDKCLLRPDFASSDEHLSRQKLPDLFVRNGAVYYTNARNIKSGQFRGKFCAPIVMTELNSWNIDTQFDLEIARFLCNAHFGARVLESQ